MLDIIQEAPEHFAAVRELTIEAFAHSELGHNGEAELVELIRENCIEYFAFVGVEDESVIGHVMFSRATIRMSNETLYGWGLAPLSVHPSHQNRGVGSDLVRFGLRSIETSGSEFVAVIGHPEYYSRFGFLPANKFSVSHGFAGIPQDFLLIRQSLNRKADLNGGLLYYDQSFGEQH